MINKLLKLLTPAEIKSAGALLIMLVFMGLFDMVGVASIIPFISVLGNPGIVETNEAFSFAYSFANNFGINNVQEFLFFTGVCFFLFLVATIVFKAFTTYLQLWFIQKCEYSIGKRMVESYLHQPYSWFINRHSADLGRTILSEVGQVVVSVIAPILSLISNGIIALSLLLLLILVDLKLAAIVGFTLTFSFTLIYGVTRSIIKRIGEARYEVNLERFKSVSDAFGASKEVKAGGLENVYVNRFSIPALAFARYQASAQVISQLPRFALEIIVFGGMLLLVLYLKAQSGNFAGALPVITLYAFSGYKLMPALQSIYAAVTQLRYGVPSINFLYQDLISLKPIAREQSTSVMPLTQSIKLNNIQYYYPQTTHPAIKCLSLTIPARSVVGLVGVTGSGKTTTVDLILGLLEAQKGTLEIDGQIITDANRRSWQRAIGYVPQQIYLTDDTIAANIAFGIDTNEIDLLAVERAARIANLHEFIIRELPTQYQTTVGERGVRLSGGQRQRIGIARAIYHNPEVLILDEATSALDNLTEQEVMDAVRNLGRKITIILIAHRLGTVKACDKIFLLDKGELKAQGNFHELIESNQRFREMAETL